MNTDKTLEIESDSLQDTLNIGERLGRNLRPGNVVELLSDLGGGKTALVRGIAKGAGSQAQVASPSFTISREYKSPNFTIHHYDFYRLHDAGVVKAELQESITNPEVVTIVEWGDIVHDVLPPSRLKITITSTGDTTRKISVTGDDKTYHSLLGELT